MELKVVKSSASQPAITENAATASATFFAMGPGRSWVAPRGTMPERDTMPKVPTMPVTLLLADGLCTETLVSVPIAKVEKLAAMATPLPLLDPPAACPRL